jgi:hypothetical protein
MSHTRTAKGLSSLVIDCGRTNLDLERVLRGFPHVTHMSLSCREPTPSDGACLKYLGKALVAFRVTGWLHKCKMATSFWARAVGSMAFLPRMKHVGVVSVKTDAVVAKLGQLTWLESLQIEVDPKVGLGALSTLTALKSLELGVRSPFDQLCKDQLEAVAAALGGCLTDFGVWHYEAGHVNGVLPQFRRLTSLRLKTGSFERGHIPAGLRPSLKHLEVTFDAEPVQADMQELCRDLSNLEVLEIRVRVEQNPDFALEQGIGRITTLRRLSLIRIAYLANDPVVVGPEGLPRGLMFLTSLQKLESLVLTRVIQEPCVPAFLAHLRVLPLLQEVEIDGRVHWI